MKNKNVKRVFAIIIASLLMTTMTACGGNNSNREDIEDIVTEKESVTTTNTEDLAEVIEPKDTVDEITYKEEEDLFLIEDVDHSNQKKVDMDSLKPDSKSYVLNKSVDIYYTDAIFAGYTKENISVNTITSNEEWTYVAFAKSSWLVKTDELKEATTEVEKTTENSKSENIVPTEKSSYTVTDMNKTMYAKQSVNLRSGPDTSYDKVGNLSTNQEVKITGQANTGWYRISFDGGIAFVSNKYLSENKVEVNTSTSNTSTSNNNNDGNASNSNNNNGNSNNGSNEQVAPAPEQIVPEPTPQPSTSVSAETAIANADAAMRNAGFITFTEGVQQAWDAGLYEEWGWSYEEAMAEAPTFGAGYFIGYVTANGNAEDIVNTYIAYGHTSYYLEYQGVANDGTFKFKCYY